MKQSLANSPFIVDLSISHKGDTAIIMIIEEVLNSIILKGCMPVTKMYVGVNIFLLSLLIIWGLELNIHNITNNKHKTVQKVNYG